MEQERIKEERRQERKRKREEEKRKRDDLIREQLALDIKMAQGRYEKIKAEGKYHLVKGGFGENINCPIKLEKIKQLKRTSSYQHPVLKKIIDGTFWNGQFYGYLGNGKNIYIGRDKIVVFPDEVEWSCLEDHERKTYRKLYAQLKELQGILHGYKFGMCSNCEHYVERLTLENEAFEVCSYREKQEHA